MNQDVLRSVEIVSRFGFINRSLFWDHVCESKQRMKYYAWDIVKKSGLFTAIESGLGTKEFLKFNKRGKIYASSLNLHPVRLVLKKLK